MRNKNCFVFVTAGLLIAGYSAAINAAPRVQTGPNAEVTHDGLTRVDRSVMDAAWVKADLDLRGYARARHNDLECLPGHQIGVGKAAGVDSDRHGRERREPAD